MRSLSRLLAATLFCAVPASALAQAPPLWPKWFISAGGSALATSTTFDQTSRTRINAEDATVEGAYDSGRGMRFEIAAGRRLGKKAGAALTFATGPSEGRVSFKVAVPHPFFFNQARVATLDTKASRTATDVHLSLSYIARETAKTLITLSAGPSYSTLTQELATTPIYSEVYPFDTITLASLTMPKVTRSGVGFHAGASGVRRLNRRWAISTDVRWSGATITFAPTGGSAKAKTGGLAIGAGLRVVF